MIAIPSIFQCSNKTKKLYNVNNKLIKLFYQEVYNMVYFSKNYKFRIHMTKMASVLVGYCLWCK